MKYSSARAQAYLALFLAPHNLLIVSTIIITAVISSFLQINFDMPKSPLEANLMHFGHFSQYFLFLMLTIFFTRTRYSGRKETLLHDILYKILFLGSIIVAFTLHFTIKIIALLANPSRYDHVYLAINHALEPIIRIFKLIATLPFFNDGGANYHPLFMALFWIALLISYMQSYRHFMICITMIIFNFTLGAFSFFIAPAYGPFVYETPYCHFFSTTFKEMLGFTRYVEASGGNLFYTDFFLGALAAMPSFHLAQTICLFWVIYKSPSGLLRTIMMWFFSYATVYISVWAVLSGFHYLIDLVAGLVIAIISIIFSQWSCERYVNYQQKMREKPLALRG